MRPENDEQLVMAYVDGELDVTETAALELRMKQDSRLRELAQEFGSTRKVLKDAFAGEIERPVKEDVLALFNDKTLQVGATTSSNIVRLSDYIRKPDFRYLRRYSAIAASLILAIGLGTGFLLNSGTDIAKTGIGNNSVLFALNEIEPQRILETDPTGEVSSWAGRRSDMSGRMAILATFQNRSGQYCRQYVQSISGSGRKTRISAVSCRNGQGQWNPVFVRLYPATGASPDTRTSAYVPAAGDDDAIFYAATNSMMKGDPLDADSERRLLKAWGSKISPNAQ